MKKEDGVTTQTAEFHSWEEADVIPCTDVRMLVHSKHLLLSCMQAHILYESIQEARIMKS